MNIKHIHSAPETVNSAKNPCQAEKSLHTLISYWLSVSFIAVWFVIRDCLGIWTIALRLGQRYNSLNRKPYTREGFPALDKRSLYWTVSWIFRPE